MPHVPHKFTRRRLKSSSRAILPSRRRVQSRFRLDLLGIAEQGEASTPYLKSAGEISREAT